MLSSCVVDILGLDLMQNLLVRLATSSPCAISSLLICQITALPSVSLVCVAEQFRLSNCGREQKPSRAPVLIVHLEKVVLPVWITCHVTVRNSRNQLQAVLIRGNNSFGSEALISKS